MNPIAKKRWRRFRSVRRAWWSLVCLAILYLATLAAELFCGGEPLFLRMDGKCYFPFCRFYPEAAFVPGGRQSRADYLALERKGVFQGAFVVWPLVRSSPMRIVPEEEMRPYLRKHVVLEETPLVAGLSLTKDGKILQAKGLENFVQESGDVSRALEGRVLEEFWKLPADWRSQLERRLDASRAQEGVTWEVSPLRSGVRPALLRFSPLRARAAGGMRKRLYARVLEAAGEGEAQGLPRSFRWRFVGTEEMPRWNRAAFETLPEEVRGRIQEALAASEKAAGGVVAGRLAWRGREWRLAVEKEGARYPFRPFHGHWMGLDNAGRDVFARIFHALRLALNFGAILVLVSMTLGAMAGILQGYAGGWVDLTGQRLTEIWSALPFLYVMILMGSIYGAGFGLLLFCYALFNWIGISYYMRAETLRLRKQPFVEAAKCLGVPGWRIAWKHILPNAQVPLVTFFPFSLVGAIGSLAALDYLGFGLPPPSPSLGELLSQAQAQPQAWWLIFYPSLALFCVMLGGVFVGEGIRNAFDPRRQNRLQ